MNGSHVLIFGGIAFTAIGIVLQMTTSPKTFPSYHGSTPVSADLDVTPTREPKWKTGIIIQPPESRFDWDALRKTFPNSKGTIY